MDSGECNCPFTSGLSGVACQAAGSAGLQHDELDCSQEVGEDEMGAKDIEVGLSDLGKIPIDVPLSEFPSQEQKSRGGAENWGARRAWDG